MDIIESVEQLAADVMLRRERRSGSHPCGRISHIHVVAMAISLIESETIATASCFSSIRTKKHSPHKVMMKVMIHDDGPSI